MCTKKPLIQITLAMWGLVAVTYAYAAEGSHEQDAKGVTHFANATTAPVTLWLTDQDDPSIHDGDTVDDPLPPLEEELWFHGGSYLYDSERDRRDPSHPALRLPESWETPRPLTYFQEFLGSDPIKSWPKLKWFGDDGFQWEPRFVGYGSYEMFGLFMESNDRRQDGVGHQLLLDLDLRITGTERAHVQFRPLGQGRSGGSFYQFSNPSGYQDNSTGVPDRWWIEGELFSIVSGLVDDQFTPRDYHVSIGKFPLSLHNRLLVNDDVTGVIINKNNILHAPISNVNTQVFYLIDDVDAFKDAGAEMYGVHVAADWRNALLEGTFSVLEHNHIGDRNATFAAVSGTKFVGLFSMAARALFKQGDDTGRGDGQLYVLETNYSRGFSEEIVACTGVQHAVFYANGFKATSGWNSISGGNFGRLRSSFAVDPLISISTAGAPDDTAGAALGAQLFRHNDDQSIIPEIAYEDKSGTSVWGVGLRFLHKLGARTYLEVLGVHTWSSEAAFEREGAFVSTFVVF